MKVLITCSTSLSGIGKGVYCASVLYLLKARGERVNYYKLEQFASIDASLCHPGQHGSVWISPHDGLQVDMDLGTVWAIAGIELSSKNYTTNGQLFQELTQRERSGEFLGKTVDSHQYYNLIHEKIDSFKDTCDILVLEIGGCAEDSAAGLIMEAIYKYKLKHGSDVLISVLAPLIVLRGEIKTRVLQNSLKNVLKFGLHPDILICRCPIDIPDKIIDKISDLTGIDKSTIFKGIDVDTVYKVPLMFYDQNLDDLIADKFKLKRNGIKIKKYRELVEKYSSPDLKSINIALVGKYVKDKDAYIFVIEALSHAAASCNRKVNIKFVHTEDLEKEDLNKIFENQHGVIIPGAFGDRGFESLRLATKYSRTNKIPFLGLCMGLQTMCIEFAANVCGLTKANSEEFSISPEEDDLVVHYIPGQQSLTEMGNTLRAGKFAAELKEGTIIRKLYGKPVVEEVHRHRYEVNEKYVPILEENGLIVSGRNPGTNLVEFAELDTSLHPFMVSTQSHPEYSSRLDKSSPLFVGFIKAAIDHEKSART